mmetsp:Transcript_28806/g.42713  ORF Transcript_28806/g.42713 Transcript_28806/m.42713 type:complete len:87 (-) Transcript_28806:1693-1953(-)
MWKNHQWSDSINQRRHKLFVLFMPSKEEMKEQCTRFFVFWGLFLPSHHQKCTVAVRSTGVHITPSAGPRPSTAAQSSSDISCHGQR